MVCGIILAKVLIIGFFVSLLILCLSFLRESEDTTTMLRYQGFDPSKHLFFLVKSTFKTLQSVPASYEKMEIGRSCQQYLMRSLD